MDEVTPIDFDFLYCHGRNEDPEGNGVKRLGRLSTALGKTVAPFGSIERPGPVSWYDSGKAGKLLEEACFERPTVLFLHFSPFDRDLETRLERMESRENLVLVMVSGGGLQSKSALATLKEAQRMVSGRVAGFFWWSVDIDVADLAQPVQALRDSLSKVFGPVNGPIVQGEQRIGDKEWLSALSQKAYTLVEQSRTTDLSDDSEHLMKKAILDVDQWRKSRSRLSHDIISNRLFFSISAYRGLCEGGTLEETEIIRKRQELLTVWRMTSNRWADVKERAQGFDHFRIAVLSRQLLESGDRRALRNYVASWKRDLEKADKAFSDVDSAISRLTGSALSEETCRALLDYFEQAENSCLRFSASLRRLH